LTVKPATPSDPLDWGREGHRIAAAQPKAARKTKSSTRYLPGSSQETNFGTRDTLGLFI